MAENISMKEEKDLNLAVDVIMLAGTLLLQSGSEIYRVEDTMIRIAFSWSNKQVYCLAASTCSVNVTFFVMPTSTK